MYLLKIMLLQQETSPVPVPLLAQGLSVSPVSANEMCRKLTDSALIKYEPYKGVTLTAQGTTRARRVLRNRRLWEVFFVEKLGIEPHPAEEMACRFEHVTPSTLAHHLAAFLGDPTHSPQNQPIPADKQSHTVPPLHRLSQLAAGELGQVVNVKTNETSRAFLHHQGLRQGVTVEVLAIGIDGAFLLNLSEQQLSLSAEMAGSVEVTVSSVQ